MGSGWHRGISSLVRLTAMMPATRATPSTSPFFAVPSTMARIVSALTRIFPLATAVRAVSCLSVTSTMTA